MNERFGSLSTLWQGVKFGSIGLAAGAIKVIDPEMSRRYLLSTLGSMPGLGAKAAQLLGMKLGLNGRPGHAIEPLPIEPLPIEPMSLATIKSLIARHAPMLHDSLVDIDPKPIVASLGQVHRARLNTGEDICIKIRFPGIEASLLQELHGFFALGSASPARHFGVDFAAIETFLRGKFQNELDYRHEAATQCEMAAKLAPWSQFVVPQVFENFTTEQILVQSWEPSVSLDDAIETWSTGERQQATALLFSFFLVSLLKAHCLHADTHPGNWGLRRGAMGFQLVLYDFGAVQSLTIQQVSTLQTVAEMLIAEKPVRFFDALVHLGFDGQKLAKLGPRLTAIGARLFEPLTTDRPWRFSDWNLREHFDRILGPDTWWFRTAGPPWFLYFMRSWQGLAHGMNRLGGAVGGRQMFLQLAASSPEQSEQLIPLVADRYGAEASAMAVCARRLYVQVFAESHLGRREVVNLEMPAQAVDELALLMPPEVLEKAKDQGLDVDETMRRAQRSGYLPQTLFDWQHEGRHYRVYLG